MALAYLGQTGGIGAPDIATTANIIAPQIPASLAYSGTDVIITGSIGNLFQGGTFSGPNRSDKTSRQRATVSVAAISDDFEGARLKIASLRAEAAALVAEANSETPRISMASVDPSLASEALNAINAIEGSDDPSPIDMPKALAYARENTPATDFTKTGKKVSEKELWCLATAIYFEARGESYRGQVAVAQVVMNRVKHKLYPSTVCGVVFQNQAKRNACQFSFACDGIPERVTDKKSWATATEIAEKVTADGLYLTEVANATHYHATYVSPRWAPRLTKLTKIGLHIFYRFKNG